MKTFSSFSLFTLVCLGSFLLFTGNAFAQKISFEAETEAAIVQRAEYEVGDTTPLTITLKREGSAVQNERITFISERSGAATISPSAGTTDNEGKVVTHVTFNLEGPVVIIVRAPNFFNATYRHVFQVGRVEDTRIVATPIHSDGLAVGDTFTYQIEIKNVADLSAWQMDIRFNPRILEVVTVTPGDFLASDGFLPFFSWSVVRGQTAVGDGEITARQARIGQEDQPSHELVNSPLGVNGSGELLTISFRVLAFAEESLGLHNVQLSNSVQPRNSDPRNGRISYHTVINPVVVTREFYPEDVNRDGKVNVQDLVMVAGSIGQIDFIYSRADVNDDGVVSVLDLVAVYRSPRWGKDVQSRAVRDANSSVGTAPAASVGNITPETIQGWIGLAHIADDGSLIFKRGIANLEGLLRARVPTETKLLRNYPNPFNPETWIPYQLAKSADVTLTIYSVSGTPVRTLALGHQPAGLYQNRSRAAYWDGRNELGTQVTSGIYFYKFTADDFSATGKMLVRK